MNELSQKVKSLSWKRLRKDFITKLSILNRKKYFYLKIFPSYLAFISAKKYIKYFSDTTHAEWWKSNEMSEENIENITKSERNVASSNHNLLPDMNSTGHCLIKSNITILKKVINLHISNTLGPQLKNLNTSYIR